MNVRRRVRISVGGAAAAMAVGLSLIATPAAGADGVILGAGSPDAIPGSYVVMLKDSAVPVREVGSTVARLADAADAKVEHTYSSALRGFAGSMDERAAKRLAADPAVAFVSVNQVVRAGAHQANPPAWGVDRVDQRHLPLDNHYRYDTTASNVNVYVIDTGIRTTHTEFGGRALWRVNTTADSNNTDCNGHGTHVAGTVGGAEHGIAKQVRLHAVKVLACDGGGTTASVVGGVDWVTANHVKPAVANMSLGGPEDYFIDQAVHRSIAAGITYVVASGNGDADACESSPARVSSAITVNASTRGDARASFSNHGGCTDLFAPGEDIRSASRVSDTATAVLSGTSMAAPHVAGAAALYLSGNPAASPATVTNAITAAATPDKITDPKWSPNLLLHTLDGSPPPPGDPFGAIDIASSQQGGHLIVQGWTIDPDALGVSTQLHVYVDGPAGSGAYGVAFVASVHRPDIAANHPGAGAAHGYSGVLSGIAPGLHTMYIYAINAAGSGNSVLLGVRQATATAAPSGSPFGSLDTVSANARAVGWTIDPDSPTTSTQVHVYVDGPAGSGAPGYAFIADRSRPDVGAAFPGAGDYHGYLTDRPPNLPSGTTHVLYIYMINAAGPGDSVLLTARAVTVS